ncbi:NADAR family protein [Endothiovibrio diazotrophicus]
MIFSFKQEPTVYVSRGDPTHLLAAFSRHGFELDGAEWPSVEHYYQGMKFEDDALREAVRGAPDPNEAREVAKRHQGAVRGDWRRVRETVMTRGVYIKSRAHPEVARALLATGSDKIVENSQYDYFWGCGRDGRGENRYGKVLMAVRDKLRELEEVG